jgi:hypothetical protein
LLIHYWPGISEDFFMRKTAVLFAVVMLIAAVTFMLACGGGNSGRTQAQMGTVAVSISDPPTCGSTQGGPFQNIYVAIRDVQINASANAGDNDANWIDLTPSLSAGAPMQVDLLGLSDSQCFLAQLGSGTQIQAGSYGQIRILLADNSSAISNDKCSGVGANCVVLKPVSPDVLPTYLPLQLSSEAHTGLKIPSGQIAGGQFTVAAGETKDLNIDFLACASIVRQGNSQYRLKPVLHAGEVGLTSTSINGTIVDSDTHAPITGNVIVALEQKDSTGVDRVIMEMLPNNLGQFVFCPVPEGTYDVVAVAVDSSSVAYAPTVTTGVQPGNAVGEMLLFKQAPSPGTSAAQITGDVTTNAASDARVSALLPLDSSTMVTVPFALESKTSVLFSTTANQPSTYTVSVPVANLTVGAFQASGTSYAASTNTTVTYTMDALASIVGSTTQSTCTPSEQKTDQLASNTGSLTVTPGQTFTASTLAFTGCQ